MANSAKKGERLRSGPCFGPAKLLQKSLNDIKKESCSQNSNISKGASNEILKNHSTPCQETYLLHNDKLYEDKSKPSLHSRKYADHQDAQDIPTSRHFRFRSSFNNCDEYNANTGHDDRLKKSYDFSDGLKSSNSESRNIYQKKLLPSNNTFCDNYDDQTKPFLNSKQTVDQTDSTQVQIPRYNIRSHNRSNNSDEYNRNDCDIKNSFKPKSNYLNSSSHADTSCRKPYNYDSNFKQDYNNKDFNKDCSKFKDVSNFQKHPYNTKKYVKSSQHSDSYKCNFSRNPHKISDQYYQNDEAKPNCRSNQNTKIQDQRSCTELNETLMGGQMKNIKITLKQSIPDSVTNASNVSNPSIISSVSNAPILSTISSVPPVSSISSVHPASNISSVSEISNASPDFLLGTVLKTNSNLSSFNVFDDSNGFIPSPVSCDSPRASEKCAGKNGTFLQNSGAESKEVDSNADAQFSLPNLGHLQAISHFIEKVVAERLIHSNDADKVVCDLNRLFKDRFEGNVIDYYGSYYCGLAITTSDINLMLKADVSIRKDFMFEIYKVLSKDLEKYHVHHYEEGVNVCKIRINFTHPNTGINCELAYLGKTQDKYLKMGKFLKAMCTKDLRTKQLIIAVKVWAEHFNINDAEDGKLHPIGFALSVIHFLQHCKNPILPIYSNEVEFQDMERLPHNDSSVGALWLGFLWYYGFVFNWQDDILTVTSMDRVSKKSKHWENYWMAIEDPFTLKNIAASVINKDVADNIKSCFKVTYNYFLNGPEVIPSFENAENQNIKESSSQLEFSFNDCFLEQDDDVCEMCYEIDDLCDECKKKIYVQPMASVPKMTDDFLKVIEKALLTVYNKYMLSNEEVNERREFVKNLEISVRKIYPEAQLNLFGSSANGFGFNKSDLDICMTFESKTKFKTNAVLCDLRRLLRRDGSFVDVIAIFNAHIPILKFRYEPKGWLGDISLDNVLAVYNSELLYNYSLIDERCRILGCALKLLAKKAQIADVTEKALSSYSYLIMVIHFLQQTDPPVLPVLQDNQFREDFELDDIIDNCNVWFCKKIDYIKEKFRTKNDTPVGQLFLDLLDYYCSFDNNQVITIQQKEKLPFSEKMRSARLFHIQDPFLLTKNLGCVVSPTKAKETRSVFNRARMLFRTPKKETPSDLENHFFSTMSLTGRIKKEALCDYCGKFGHDKNDCRQSSPQKKFFKSFPRKYTNQNNFYKRKQLNRQSFVKK